MSLPVIQLKRQEDRRIRAGHPWVFSNEIDTAISPLKSFTAGEEVIVKAFDKTPLGIAYINPHSLIAARLFTNDIDQRLDISFFIQKMTKALAMRESFFNKPYYRLIYSEADGLPGLIIDRFHRDFVLQINTAGMELKKEIIAAALLQVIPNLNSILLRNDSNIRMQENLTSYVDSLHGISPEIIELEENNTRFLAPLWRGQKTGWFYDHRMNRARLRDYVHNKTVLDVFSYLGGWGVQAAAFGAQHVDCIESSAFACEFIRNNANLNQVGDKTNVICDDAFDAMKSLLQQGKSYDVIILDPPAFVKKAKDRKEGLIAYQRLNELAFKLLVPGGILFSCSCSMQVGMEDLMQLIQRAAYRAQTATILLERGHQGPDHPIHFAIPESDYLKLIIAKKA